MKYTKEDVKQSLRKLGLRSGMNIVLDLDGSFEEIIGEEKTILDAIIEIIGYEATLLIPSFTRYLAHPISKNMEIEYELLKQVDYSFPHFDIRKSLPETTAAKQMMVYEDSLRSNHPMYSFLAWGKYAQSVISQHPLHFALSKHSPIGKMKDLGAYYLNINLKENVFFDFVATSTRIQNIKVNVVPIIYKDQRQEKELLEYDFNTNAYQHIEKLMEKENLIFTSQIGEHKMTLCSMFKTYPLIQLLLTK